MTTVLLVVHLMVVIALVAVVLLQRSEGGALGIGGGGGGFMNSRGTANVLTRTTAILAAVFFATSMALSILPRFIGAPGSILDTVPGVAPAGTDAPIGSGQGGVLDDLMRLSPQPADGATTPEAPAAPAENTAPAAPASQAPATEAPAAPAPAAPATPAAPAQ